MRLFSDSSGPRKQFDVIVVGTGLTGGWAAKQLTQAGLNILLLDAGPLLPPQVVTDTNWWTRSRREDASRRQSVQSRYSPYWTCNPQLFVDDIENPYDSDTDFVWVRGRQVGGRSLFWPGIVLRFSDYEFSGAHEGFRSRWPIRHQDLAPYYSEVERFLQVEGTDEGLDQLPDGEFLMSPDLTETEKRFKCVIAATSQDRKLINSRGIPLEGEWRPGVHEAWSPKTSLHAAIPAAFSTGMATLRPDSIVSHLVMNRDGGSVDGVAVVDRVTKQTLELFGRAVCLCASSIESVRIMLNSGDRNHPDGVGNSSGLLGRGLADHMAVTITGTIPKSEHLPRAPRGGAHGYCIPRFRNIHESAAAFTGGYGILGGMQRGRMRGLAATNDAPWFQTALLEVLPEEKNRVKLNTARTDAWGVPTASVSLAYGDNERRMKADALSCMTGMAAAADLDIHRVEITRPGQYGHELGGARMGNDPASSVLDSFNRCWDVRNLFVLDGACFVSAGWQPPGLTMMAIAGRASNSIVDSFRRSDLGPKISHPHTVRP